MRPTARALASALASRLDAIVPRPIRVQAEDTIVNVYDGDELWAGSPASEIVEANAALTAEDDQYFDEVDEEQSAAESVDTASSAVLNAVQDFVARVLREEWPRLPNGRMALANSRTDGTRIYLWFGSDESSAVLKLPPIEIADLRDS